MEINWPLVVGQAAALITIATALVYTTGNLVLYMRSWFQRYPWSSLLQEFSATDLQLIGAGAVMPALIIGGIWAFWSESLRSRWLADCPNSSRPGDDRARFNRVFVLTPLAMVVVLAALTPISVWIATSQEANRELYRNPLLCFLVPLCFGLIFYLVGLFLVGPILTLHSITIRRVLVITLTTLIAMPGVAGVVGSRPFPAVQLCTKSYGTIAGRLVGTSDRSSYVAAIAGGIAAPSERDHFLISVPESEITVKYIGRTGERCPAAEKPE